MTICVYGLWHLGSVTAACVADAGFDTVGVDTEQPVIEDLSRGKAPLFEPGLDAMLEKGLASGHLAFTTDLSAAESAELIWVTIDTPVDDDDQADTGVVMQRIEQVLAVAR